MKSASWLQFWNLFFTLLGFALLQVSCTPGKPEAGRVNTNYPVEISTRCGQDSDCNPASVGGILGTVIGYDKIWILNTQAFHSWMPMV